LLPRPLPGEEVVHCRLKNPSPTLGSSLEVQPVQLLPLYVDPGSGTEHSHHLLSDHVASVIFTFLLSAYHSFSFIYWLCGCSPGGTGRPAHQDSAGNFTSHVANDKDMHERRRGKETAFRYDYSHFGEDEVARLTVPASATSDKYCS